MIYKAAIIGTGRIGYLLQKDKKREQPASHSIALAKNKRINLVAGCDIDHEKLALWHKDYPKANIYKNFILLMENEVPDIVIIAVDETAHLDITQKVIKYKPKLIILEKPVAQNLNLAKKIKKYAESKNVPICINHERRFSKDYLILKNLLINNKIGEIHSIHASLWSGMKVWDDTCHKDGACSLIHDGTHLIDIIHFLFDIILKNPVIDKITKNKKKEVHALFLHYNIKNEKIIYIEINGNKKYFGFELEIKGSLGRIIIGNGYFKVYTSSLSPYYSNFRSLTKDKSIKRPKRTKYFSNMIQNCVNSLDGKSKLISPLVEGIKALSVLYDIVSAIDNKDKGTSKNSFFSS